MPELFFNHHLTGKKASQSQEDAGPKLAQTMSGMNASKYAAGAAWI
jgi:hypothetical protein